MTKKHINISVPTLIDTQQFHPTCIMQKVLLAHLKEISDPECDKITNPARFLTSNDSINNINLQPNKNTVLQVLRRQLKRK